MHRSCPNCQDQSLEPAVVEGYPVELDHCPACQGLWLDSGKLQQLLGAPAPDLTVPKGAAMELRRCPDCRRRMFAFQYPGTFVTVDMCSRCHGLWLDPNEFEEIDAVRSFAAATGLTTGTNPEAVQERSVKEWLLEFIEVNLHAHKFW